MICKKCGQELGEDVRICPICKANQESISISRSTYQTHEAYSFCDVTNSSSQLEGKIDSGSRINVVDMREHKAGKRYPYTPRSRVTAGLLQIFLGGFGIGRLYLGYTGIALGQLFTFPIFFIGGVWGVIDGILILCGQVTHDANGVPIC